VTLKAYMAFYDKSDWVTFVHAETRGKAKYRFYRVDPEGVYEWNLIRLERRPKWDDKPFVVGEEYDHLFAPDTYDDEGNGVWLTFTYVDCDCPLCKGAK
jgi:hypothetical protein